VEDFKGQSQRLWESLNMNFEFIIIKSGPLISDRINQIKSTLHEEYFYSPRDVVLIGSA
jgi:hypothetical protein